MEREPAILLMGPTASGKTGLALELARALPVEIVSVDSALVYRGMDIGTAKPSAALRAEIPHHLVDLLDPKKDAEEIAKLKEQAETTEKNIPRMITPVAVALSQTLVPEAFVDRNATVTFADGITRPTCDVVLNTVD